MQVTDRLLLLSAPGLHKSAGANSDSAKTRDVGPLLVCTHPCFLCEGSCAGRRQAWGSERAASIAREDSRENQGIGLSGLHHSGASNSREYLSACTQLPVTVVYFHTQLCRGNTTRPLMLVFPESVC